ncbi:MAG TPA: hypothetical protein VGC80_01515, partial [Acetobacteraceae bacterium]
PRLITAAGVSAGLDLGLALARRFMGDAYAAKLELLAELRSAPDTEAHPAVGALQEMFAPLLAQAEAAADSARADWPPAAATLEQIARGSGHTGDAILESRTGPVSPDAVAYT